MFNSLKLLVIIDCVFHEYWVSVILGFEMRDKSGVNESINIMIYWYIVLCCYAIRFTSNKCLLIMSKYKLLKSKLFSRIGVNEWKIKGFCYDLNLEKKL